MKKSYHVIIAILFSSPPLFAQVDYDTQIQTIFNASCTSCHGANGGVNLSSFEQLMNSVGNAYGDRVVVPFEPDSSGLVDKIEPNPMFGSRMPQGGMLNQSDIDLIRQWVSEGANAVPASNEGESVNPEEFKLLGNYPNPFNPGTLILFDVPVATQYTVSIFSINGQLITEQIGNASSGRVQVPVNLGVNPSGVYFYKVSAQMNGSRQLIGTGQMTLIK